MSLLRRSDDLDTTATARLIASGELSPVEVVDRCLERIREVDDDLGAFTVTFADDARDAARRAEADVRSGVPLGLLHGVPVAIKDHIWIQGQLATNGSRALADFMAPEDSVSVSRLRNAGAILVGKTNNPEFCYRGYTDNDLWGLTRNPHDLGRTPGGSSGGSAAAVASGMVSAAMGTDGGGSIRLPAAFCGVVGHKPTFGLVPKDPGFRGWKTLSVTGPITASVRDAALMLDVIAGPHPADDLSYPSKESGYLAALTGFAESGPDGLRIAFSTDLGFAPVDADVLDGFRSAIGQLRRAGVTVTEAYPAAEDPISLWNAIALPEGYSSEGPLLTQWEGQMVPGSADIIRAGKGVSANDYLEAVHARAAYTRRWLEFFEDFDALLTPMAQLTAFPVGQEIPDTVGGVPVDPFFDTWSNMSYPANLTGQPAISVPIGHGAGGLPIGMQVIGRRFEDLTVLRVAALVERLVNEKVG